MYTTPLHRQEKGGKRGQVFLGLLSPAQYIVADILLYRLLQPSVTTILLDYFTRFFKTEIKTKTIMAATTASTSSASMPIKKIKAAAPTSVDTQAMRVALSELSSGSTLGEVYVQPSKGAAFFLEDREVVRQQVIGGLNQKSSTKTGMTNSRGTK
jgi:hypothetical protein